MSFWWRVIVALLVGAHGVGHILFLLPLWGMADWGQSARSWLLGEGWLAKGVSSVIWIVAIVGFTAVAFGLLRQTDWWRTIAIIAAAVSTLGLLLFWASPPGSPVVSALVFNLLVLGALLLFHWPPAVELAG